MSFSANHCPAGPEVQLDAEARGPSRRFWPAIIRIAILEAVLLLALAGAVVGYLNWSSDVAFAEFLSASQTPAAGSSPRPAKGHCERGA
jgi:hypothetical protein